LELGTHTERRDQLQQIAETALELFGPSFLGGIYAGGTTADVVCRWLRKLAAIRKATGPPRSGQRVCMFSGRGDGI
jgi:hypothetical protein